MVSYILAIIVEDRVFVTGHFTFLTDFTDLLMKLVDY